VSIKAELADELKSAMRSQDRNRIDVIRQINSEVEKAVTAPGFDGEADDELYKATIAAYAKKMTKALREYEGYGERGAAAAGKLRFEVDYLARWLPRGLSESEISALVDAAVAELGAGDMKAMGQVMGHVMKQHEGLDGTLVSRLVRERLAGDG
jgi:uncharacterized protein YqeY